MTREEAIEVIKLAMAQVEWDYPMDYAAAFDMAIKALEQEPTTKNDLGVDCIDRAEVLKLMQDNWHTHNGDWAMQESMDDIRALPSVTPQEPITNFNIPFLMHKGMDIPISECQKAYDVAIEYLRSQGKLKG